NPTKRSPTAVAKRAIAKVVRTIEPRRRRGPNHRPTSVPVITVAGPSTTIDSNGRGVSETTTYAETTATIDAATRRPVKVPSRRPCGAPTEVLDARLITLLMTSMFLAEKCASVKWQVLQRYAS